MVTLPTKSETATCQIKSRAAGFSKDRVSELFYLIEISVEHKLNTTRIYVHNVYEKCHNKISEKKNRKSDMEKRNTADLTIFKCEREEPIQKQSDVSAVLVATHLLR